MKEQTDFWINETNGKNELQHFMTIVNPKLICSEYKTKQVETNFSAMYMLNI